nr:hypothetical protein GCM10020241_49970 [Streptoalloteichus tenebrarius]
MALTPVTGGTDSGTDSDTETGTDADIGTETLTLGDSATGAPPPMPMPIHVRTRSPRSGAEPRRAVGRAAFPRSRRPAGVRAGAARRPRHGQVTTVTLRVRPGGDRPFGCYGPGS